MNTTRDLAKAAGREKEYENNLRNRRWLWAVVLFCGYSAFFLAAVGLFAVHKGDKKPLTWLVVLVWLFGGIAWVRILNPRLQKAFDYFSEKK
jgi:hypothetical protein